MKINWFKIENFRSIIDSGKCYMDTGITVLAGKNESGKSNILRALECFGNDDFKDNFPQDKQEEVNPKVTISFNFSNKELEAFFSEQIEDDNTFELILSKSDKYAPGYSGACFDAIAKTIIDKENSEKADILKLIKSICSLTKKINKIQKSDVNFVNYKKSVTDYITTTLSILPNYDENIRLEVKTMIDEINNKLRHAKNITWRLKKSRKNYWN